MTNRSWTATCIYDGCIYFLRVSLDAVEISATGQAPMPEAEIPAFLMSLSHAFSLGIQPHPSTAPHLFAKRVVAALNRINGG